MWVLKGTNGGVEPVGLDVDAGEPGGADEALEVSFARAPFEGPGPRTTERSLQGAGGGAGRRGDVFDEAVGAAGAQDAADLGEDVGGVGHRAEHERGDHAVDAVVGQVGVLGDTVVELEVHAPALGGGPQPSVHVGVGFDGDERGPGGQVAEVGTHSGAELDDLLGQLAEDAPLVLAEVPLEVRPHQAEERGVEATTRPVHLEAGRG